MKLDIAGSFPYKYKKKKLKEGKWGGEEKKNPQKGETSNP